MSTVGLTSIRGPDANITSPSSRRVRTGPGQCPFAGVNASHHDQYRLQRDGQHHLLSRTRRRRDRATINSSITTTNSSSSSNPHIITSTNISQLLAATALAAAIPSVPQQPTPSTVLVNLGQQRVTYHHPHRFPGPTAVAAPVASELAPSQDYSSNSNRIH